MSGNYFPSRSLLYKLFVVKHFSQVGRLLGITFLAEVSSTCIVENMDIAGTPGPGTLVPWARGPGATRTQGRRRF